MKSMLCLYHGADFDGKCSGYLVKEAYEELGFHVTLEPIDYNYPTPWKLIEGKDVVVICDFSVSPEDILGIASMCGKLIWIDHHISAIKTWELFLQNQVADINMLTNITTVLVDGQAGCELTYDYFNPGKQRPYAIHLLGRYDVWDMSNLNLWNNSILPFQWGLRSHTMDPRTEDGCRDWEHLFGSNSADNISIISNDGKIILTYQLATNEWYCKYGREIDFADRSGTYKGFRTFAVNTGMKSSLVFQHLIDKDAYDLYMVYIHTKDGFEISLYNTNGKIDCSVIAKSYGGGGHRGAAGFKSMTADFFCELIEGSYEYTFSGTGLPDTRLTTRPAENSNVPLITG